MENTKEQITINDLINDMKEINKSLDRSKKIKQKLINLLKERVAEKTKNNIPDKIIIHMDFQVW